MNQNKIAILILAAGESKRIGRPKQLLAWGKTTLLEHTIKQATQSDANKVFVVLGAYLNEIKKSTQLDTVTVLENDRWLEGMGSSIALGAKHLQKSKYDGILIMLADQPQIDTTYLNSLMDKFEKDKKQIIATVYGNRVGVPALFDSTYFKKLASLKSDVGARQIIEEYAPFLTTIVPQVSIADIDTMEAYKRLHDEFFSD